jgi:hypothetical protein
MADDQLARTEPALTIDPHERYTGGDGARPSATPADPPTDLAGWHARKRIALLFWRALDYPCKTGPHDPVLGHCLFDGGLQTAKIIMQLGCLLR